MGSTVLNENMILEEMDQNVLNLYLLNGTSDPHFKMLNKLLSSSKTVKKGLDLLNAILNNVTSEDISEYSTYWIECCLKNSAEIYTEAKLVTISKVIELSCNNHDVLKRVLSDHLSKIVDICLEQKKHYDVLAALEVLRVCMKTFGSWFTSHKSRIETYLISFLENSSEALVEKTAIGFLYLQQIGNAGADSINYRKNFSDFIQKLCATIHALFDELFENRADINHVDKPNQEPFVFNNQSFDTILLLSINSLRFKNVLKCIEVMIKKGFSFCKEISPMDILNVVVRGTTMHHCLTEKTNNSQEDYNFGSILISIQVQLINLLRVFIIWLKSNSYPYSFIISKILMDCLKKTQNCKCFDSNVFYQETIYLTINCWIKTSRIGINKDFQEELVACILKDITPIKNSVSLKIQDNKKGNNKSQNILNLNSQRNLFADTEKSKCARERDEIRCYLALKILTTLFDCSYVRLEMGTLNNIYKLVISVFNEIHTATNPHPYRNHKCQINLLKLLVAFYEQDTVKNVPFISTSLNILKEFSFCNNGDIAKVCEKGLNILEKICQPISLPFTLISALHANLENDASSFTISSSGQSSLNELPNATMSGATIISDSIESSENLVKSLDNSMTSANENSEYFVEVENLTLPFEEPQKEQPNDIQTPPLNSSEKFNESVETIEIEPVAKRVRLDENQVISEDIEIDDLSLSFVDEIKDE